MHSLQKIVSGGQTGADRAALDAARSVGLQYGGWVPRDRQAEDGVIDPKYVGLRETQSADPAERTRRNVVDSDATLIVSHGPLVSGSALTLGISVELGKPVLHLDLRSTDPSLAVRNVITWLCEHEVSTLNVAGPRASEDCEVYAATFDLVSAILHVRRE